MKILNFIKTYWHAILFVLALLACLVLCIGGIGWTDYANSKFWQVAWVVLAFIGGIGFAGLIYWLINSKKQW
jgi:hypothetical protein